MSKRVAYLLINCSEELNSKVVLDRLSVDLMSIIVQTCFNYQLKAQIIYFIMLYITL